MAITKAICHKDFSGNSSILPRINFCASGQGRSPQSLTAATLKRYESKMINLYIDSISVKRSHLHKVKNVSRYVFDYIYFNYQYKDSLLKADLTAFEASGREYNNKYYQSLWNQSKVFTSKLITDSSKSTAEFFRTPIHLNQFDCHTNAVLHYFSGSPCYSVQSHVCQNPEIVSQDTPHNLCFEMLPSLSGTNPQVKSHV